MTVWNLHTPLADDKILISSAGARTSPRCHAGFCTNTKPIITELPAGLIMSFPLLFACIPFSYLPIPSSGLLKNCFVNFQFTCQIALVKRFPRVAGEIQALNRELVPTAAVKHAPPFRVCGCDMQRARFGTTPHAGPSAGQESHLPSLGDVMYKSRQWGECAASSPWLSSSSKQAVSALPMRLEQIQSDDVLSGPLSLASRARFLRAVWQGTWRWKEGEEMWGGSTVLACFESQFLRSRCSKSHVEKCLWSDAAWSRLLIVSWDGSWQIE